MHSKIKLNPKSVQANTKKQTLHPQIQKNTKNRLDKNKELLIYLSKCQKKIRNSIIEKCSKDNIYSICECVLNVCNGVIKLNKLDFKKLKPYSKTFKKLLDRKIKIKEKKKLLIQKGGFLQFLIPAIITGLSSIISASISKKE